MISSKKQYNNKPLQEGGDTCSGSDVDGVGDEENMKKTRMVRAGTNTRARMTTRRTRERENRDVYDERQGHE